MTAAIALFSIGDRVAPPAWERDENTPNFLGRRFDRSAVAGLRELAEPWPSGSKVKEAIDRASKAAGLPYWRTFDIWYGKARRVEQFERDTIDSAVADKRREAARNELHELRTRLVRLESLLVQTDPDFHRPSIDAAREQVRAMGRADGAASRAVDRVK